MKSMNLLVLISVVLVNSVTFTSAQVKPANISGVQMGVSQVNITPEVPVLMSGYEARKTPSTGVHDQLFASALFFKNEKTSILLITADLIGYSKQFVDETRKKISAITEIPPENIMITAVHNHGAPVTRAYEKNVPEAVENYIKELQDKFINLAVRASTKPVPFRMGTGKGICTMNINRRAEFADGGIWLGRDPDKPCDHEVTVTKFEDLNGKTLAAFVNWPCHATTNGQDNYQITADWPGAAARFIKKQTGDETVVAITAGASGDINPIYGPGNDFNEIEAVGYHVGKVAWETFNKIETHPAESLAALTSTITFPGKKASKDHFPQKVYENGPDVEIALTVVRIGYLILTGISGELMNEIGSAVKMRSPYTGTVIITHCNGSSGYICTDKAFSEGGYEVKVTHLMPGAEKPLTDKILQMINTL
jgi:neutral ceramidase